MNRRRVIEWTLAVCFFSWVASLAAENTGQIIQGDDVERFLTQAKVVRQQGISLGVTLPKKVTLELDGTRQLHVQVPNAHDGERERTAHGDHRQLLAGVQGLAAILSDVVAEARTSRASASSM